MPIFAKNRDECRQMSIAIRHKLKQVLSSEMMQFDYAIFVLKLRTKFIVVNIPYTFLQFLFLSDKKIAIKCFWVFLLRGFKIIIIFYFVN